MKYPEDFVNKVILGDNLEVIPYIPDEVIDLIYLDPPYGDNNTDKIFNLEWTDMNYYISWMKPRLEECRRVLKPIGSIYLHCDHRATHYLRILLDEIFGYDNFKNTIVWCYTHVSHCNEYFPRRHYDIHFYTKNNRYTFNEIRIPYKKSPLNKTKSHIGKCVEDWWIDIVPTHEGYLTKKEDKINENFYTQKPIGLLKRIIKASSNKGDIILDPFCGSGTSLVAAWTLNRKYIGIDTSENAIKISKSRSQLRQLKL